MSAPHPEAAPAVLDADRLDALRRSALLDSGPSPEFDRLTEHVTHATSAPVSLVALIDADRSYFKSATGVPEMPPGRQVPLSHSLCQHVVGTGAPLVIDDARTNPLVRDNGGVTDLGVGAYLGVPVRAPDGQVLGSMCAIDLEARTWTAEDQSALATMAAAAQCEIALQAEQRARASAEKAQAEAERMSRLQQSFLSNMSHEIRTPLTAILGSTEVLDAEVDADLRRVVGSIRSGGERLMGTLDAILDLAQMEAGRLEARPAPVAVGELLLNVARSFAPLAESKRVALGVGIARDVPSGVILDAGLLGRAASNLIGNAVKFTESGTVTVRALHADGVLTLRVEDTGIGIDPERLPQLFEPFHQASEGHARTHEGAGLGLALVRKVAALMDGHVEATSAPGAGSTFTLTVAAPVAEGASAGVEAASDRPLAA